MSRPHPLTAAAHAIVLRLPAETAHRLAVRGLGLLPLPPAAPDDPRLAVKAFGLDFPNPLGLAAGFDKNGEAVDAILRLGFGFVEAGTVTPLAQPGNSRPRIFRLPRDSAIINRLGFNSLGHAFAHEQLAARRGRGGLVAVNLGANKASEDRVMDYVEGVKTFADVADFFVINISSPNTPGLRDLQNQSALNILLANVFAAREMAPRRVPIVVKIAPDLTLDELDGIVEVCKSNRIDGLAISNTTLSRPENLADYQVATQQGGLSGRPLFHLSTWLLAHAFLRVEGAFPLIGIGGVENAATALAKIEAGADLVELYSAFIYKGVAIAADIKRGLLKRLMNAGVDNLAALRGARAQEWAAGRMSNAELHAEV
jgi:dihydroorotate dehydrogenase